MNESRVSFSLKRFIVTGVVGLAMVTVGCSNGGGGSAPVSTPTSTGAEQGGASSGEVKESQGTNVAFQDHEKLFIENGEKATFDAITQAIALSEQGDVAGSAQILASIGFNQKMVETALKLDGNNANNDTFLQSYYEREGEYFPLTLDITAALGPGVINALPIDEQANGKATNSQVLSGYFNLIPEDSIDSTTKYNIRSGASLLTEVPPNSSFTEVQKTAWMDYAKDLMRVNSEVRSDRGLPPYSAG